MTLALIMSCRLAAFFDELEKIALASSDPLPGVAAKPMEAKPIVSPLQMKAKSIKPPSGGRSTSTDYTRSNVEAPGTNVGINMAQKVITPPPVRV